MARGWWLGPGCCLQPAEFDIKGNLSGCPLAACSLGRSAAPSQVLASGTLKILKAKARQLEGDEQWESPLARLDSRWHQFVSATPFEALVEGLQGERVEAALRLRRQQHQRGAPHPASSSSAGASEPGAPLPPSARHYPRQQHHSWGGGASPGWGTARSPSVNSAQRSGAASPQPATPLPAHLADSAGLAADCPAPYAPAAAGRAPARRQLSAAPARSASPAAAVHGPWWPAGGGGGGRRSRTPNPGGWRAEHEERGPGTGRAAWGGSSESEEAAEEAEEEEEEPPRTRRRFARPAGPAAPADVDALYTPAAERIGSGGGRGGSSAGVEIAYPEGVRGGLKCCTSCGATATPMWRSGPLGEADEGDRVLVGGPAAGWRAATLLLGSTRPAQCRDQSVGP